MPSSVPRKPSTAVAARRAIRLYGEPVPAVPGARAEIPGQMDLFSELDEAERIATEEESDNGNEGDGDAQ